MTKLRLLCLFLTLTITACSDEPMQHHGAKNAWLTRWLAQPACSPPCWENITPGATSSEEALRLLRQMPDVVDVKVQVGGEIAWELRDHDYGSLRTSKSTVESIRLSINLKEDLPVDEVIGAYGPPSEVILTRCLDGICEVDLTFPKYGIILRFVLRDVQTEGFQVRLRSTSSVGSITLVPSTEEYESDPPDERGRAAWRGYGTYP